MAASPAHGYRDRMTHLRAEFESGQPPPGTIAGLLRLSTARRATLTGVLLDNSTVIHALNFAGSGEWRQPIPENRRIVTDSLTSLIEALVLYDRIIVGGRRVLEVPGQGGLLGLGISLEAPGELAPDTRFWLMSAARREALRALDDTPEICAALEIDAGHLKTQLLHLTVRKPDSSLHQIQRYVADDSFYYSDLSSRLESHLDLGATGRNSAELDAELTAGTAIRGNDHVPRGQRLKAFFAASILYRAMYYTILADYLGHTYIGDGLRSAVLKVILGATPRRRPFADLLIRETELLENRRDHDINTALRFEAFPLSLPLVANAVLTRATTRRECITIALDIRESTQARRFRRFCAEVDEALLNGDRPTVERALKELRRYGISLSDSITGGTTKDAETGVKELVTYASPLAGALFSAFRAPVADIARQLQNRRFALLEELKASQRGTVARDRIEALWSTLP